MFTEVVELRAKPWKTDKLCDAVRNTMLPALKRQQGFQGEITLVSDTDRNRMLVLSFWSKREDAERFHCEQFSQVAEVLRPLCKCEPYFGSSSAFVPGHRFQPVQTATPSRMRQRETPRRQDPDKGAAVGMPN